VKPSLRDRQIEQAMIERLAEELLDDEPKPRATPFSVEPHLV
jgi:hypothetical protein